MNIIKLLISRFQWNDLDILHALLALATVVIMVMAYRLRQHIHAERRLRRRVASNRDCVMNLLGKASETFKDNLDLTSFITYYTEYSAHSLRAQSATFFKYDKAEKTLQAESVLGLFPTLFNTPDSVVRTLRANPQKLQEFLRATKFALMDTPFIAVITQQVSLIIGEEEMASRLACPVCECWGMIFVPISIGNAAYGVLALANRMDRAPFDAEDFQLARNLGDMAGITISHIMSFQDIQEKKMVDSQLQTAETILKHLLPQHVPQSSRFDLAVHYQPAFRLGGDYYDFIRVDETHLGVLIADVSGKGIPAGLVMATTRSLFAALAKDERSPVKVLTRLNGYLLQLIPDEMFVSMLYAVLNEETSEAIFVRAGHEPIISCKQRQEPSVITSAQGMVVGMVDDDTFGLTVREEKIKLDPAESILLYTDGLTEAQDEKGDELGRPRVMQLLKQVSGFEVEDAMKSLAHRVKKFTGRAPLYDDTTVVLIKAKQG